jgi:hypothetical protein
MTMSRHRNAGQNHKLPIVNKSLDSVARFRYLGSTVINQNCIREGIKGRLISKNAYYHSVQNLLSFHLLSKNLKIKIYKTVILPVVLYRCGAYSHTEG